MDDKNMFDGRFVKELTPADFNPVNTWELKSKECSIVLFYCPWCPHCQSVKDAWKELGKIATFVNVQALNCEKHKRHAFKIKEDVPEFIRGYPTIVVYKGGKPIEDYQGERTVSSLLKTCMRICQYD